MPESLLSFSAILLFGRKLNDLSIVRDVEEAVVLTKAALPAASADVEIRNVKLKENDQVLVKVKATTTGNGLFKLRKSAQNAYSWTQPIDQDSEKKVFVPTAKRRRNKHWQVKRIGANDSEVRRIGRGNNQFLDDQLDEKAGFARIYGFSYEGDYFDLPSPTLFLVHGDGELVSQDKNATAGKHGFPSNLSRAPRDPSIGGMAAADFQFADDIRVWDYDKADYTIRMDVATGMFEQVLLDATLGDGGFGVSGAKVSGAKVSGAKVSGAKVSGAKVSGAKARGPGD